MAKNLEELKDELYEAFNLARDKAKENTHLSAYHYPESVKANVMAVQAAAEAAHAIVAVERELAEREEKKNGMSLPGKR